VARTVLVVSSLRGGAMRGRSLLLRAAEEDGKLVILGRW
jgi:hypothetical protein